MADVYKKAERVIIWLGPATHETNVVMRSMKEMQDESINYAYKNWMASDHGLFQNWSAVRPEVRSVEHEGLKVLLGRPWFKRIWILQEVANARTAIVMCGTKSASAHIFAIVASLSGKPDHHCQAILDIMPGPLRRESWWNQRRDLRTLLVKFGKRE